MWQIDERIEDVTHPRGQISVFLNADKPMSPYHFNPPIKWSGYFDSQEVEIIQNNSSASSIDAFDFKKFPDKYSHFKGDIVGLIDEYLRILD